VDRSQALSAQSKVFCKTAKKVRVSLYTAENVCSPLSSAKLVLLDHLMEALLLVFFLYTATAEAVFHLHRSVLNRLLPLLRHGYPDACVLSIGDES